MRKLLCFSATLLASAPPLAAQDLSHMSADDYVTGATVLTLFHEIGHGDRRREFCIIPLQSALGQSLMRHYGLDPDDPLSWLFVEDGHASTSLDACIRVARRIGGIWRAALILRLIPPPLGRALYGWVARNRYRFFGTVSLCGMPDAEVQARLLVDPSKDG